MARARLLKPGFFKNERLAKMPFAHRLCFAGLWTLADREGRLENRPERIKAELFPYDATIRVRDVRRMVDSLVMTGFLVSYGIHGASRRGMPYLWIQTFLDHQTPHHREPPSRLPAPPSRHRRGPDTAADKPEKPRAQPRAQPRAEPSTGPSDPVTGDPVTGDPVPVTGTPPPAFGGSPLKGAAPARNFSRTTKRNIADAKRLIERRLGGNGKA